MQVFCAYCNKEQSNKVWFPETTEFFICLFLYVAPAILELPG